MQIRAVGLTDVGKVREHNEDYYLIDNDLQTYIVCDGMGGHAAGEVASKMAAESTIRNLKQHTDFLQKFDNGREHCAQLTEIVKDAVIGACRDVYEAANANPEQMGMGTTLTMLMLLGKRGILAHVGDSRLYLRRDEKLYKLSVDHTLMAEMLAQGIPKEDLLQSGGSLANVLTRAVGKDPTVKVDVLLFDVVPDDTFLLCSDGLNSVSNPVELETLLGHKNLDAIPEQLISLANRRDGSDNITAIVVRWESQPPVTSEDEKWTTEIHLRFDTLQQIYLFKHVTFRELSKLMAVMQVVHCDTGDLLITEGAQSNQMYVLLEGQLKITRGDKEIQVLNPGDHVGEMALLNDQPRSATVRVSKPARLLMVERDTLFNLMREESTIGVKLLWNLSRGLSSRLHQANHLAFGPIRVGLDNEEDTLRITPIPPSDRM